MSLRDLAAMDRASDNANPMGVAEAIVYEPETAAAVSLRGVWQEFPSDDRQSFGIGVQSQFSGATLDVALADVPGFTRGATFVRSATGQRWEIDEADLLAGVGYRLRLKRAGDAQPKGLR
jgi:hypothetical protein